MICNLNYDKKVDLIYNEKQTVRSLFIINVVGLLWKRELVVNASKWN
jgi:hypothetical protein